MIENMRVSENLTYCYHYVSYSEAEKICFHYSLHFSRFQSLSLKKNIKKIKLIRQDEVPFERVGPRL